MTTSIYKAIANRINARRSTGPRTQAGKHRASKNALRFGLSLPAYLFPPTKPLFEDIYRALKVELAVSSSTNANELKISAERHPSVSGFLDIQDPRSDNIARFANTVIDLCRLRAARTRIIGQLIENSDDPDAARDLQSLLRYGQRLNAQLKRLP